MTFATRLFISAIGGAGALESTMKSTAGWMRRIRWSGISTPATKRSGTPSASCRVGVPEDAFTRDCPSLPSRVSTKSRTIQVAERGCRSGSPLVLNGRRGGDRTHNPRLRRPVLYPIELLARSLLILLSSGRRAHQETQETQGTHPRPMVERHRRIARRALERIEVREPRSFESGEDARNFPRSPEEMFRLVALRGEFATGIPGVARRRDYQRTPRVTGISLVPAAIRVTPRPSGAESTAGVSTSR